jgi:hypothetical protein
VGITSALCGHLADDLFVPYTTDFIRLGRGPSANLADLYSYVGLTALFIEMMLCRRKNTEQGGGIRDRLARMCKTRRHFVRFLAGELWRILFSAGRDTESSGASRK